MFIDCFGNCASRAYTRTDSLNLRLAQLSSTRGQFAHSLQQKHVLSFDTVLVALYEYRQVWQKGQRGLNEAEAWQADSNGFLSKPQQKAGLPCPVF
eukprot:1136595-Pelagomonas_calceolata.AAC.4